MAIVTTTDAGQSFGDVDIFRNISVVIQSDSKIALVGPNGIGKTTLLMILAGLRQPSRRCRRELPDAVRRRGSYGRKSSPS